MQIFLRILILLFLSLTLFVYNQRPPKDYQSTWQNLNGCKSQQACWLGIAPARSNATQAIDQLRTWHAPLDIDVSESEHSVQWQHPQGYQGHMVFNQSAITFIEIQFPDSISNQNQIQLGDVILTQDVPDEIARFPDETTQLYYFQQLLTVRIDTTNQDVLTPQQKVISLHFFSPFGADMTRPRSLIQGYPWRGFTQLPDPPPWGP